MLDEWLLCDFHIHTTFSDGTLSLPEVIDLYGENGFDAICITDHILDTCELERRKKLQQSTWAIERAFFRKYLHVLEEEARRAWEQYGMIVMPGAEMTNNTQGYHILGLDIREFIDPDLSVPSIVHAIHLQEGLAIAPHPYRGILDGTRQLMYVWDHHEQLANLFDAWEFANRHDLFPEVGQEGLNCVANSDFHEPSHLYSWKTLVWAEKQTASIKAAIRENHSVSLYRFAGRTTGNILQTFIPIEKSIPSAVGA